MPEFRREVHLMPGFHKCDPVPSKNYGIGSATMLWVLTDGDRAIVLEMSTDWGLPEAEFLAAVPCCTHPMHVRGYPQSGKPSGRRVTLHFAEARDTTFESVTNCQFLGDRQCYGDASFSHSDDALRVLLTKGSDGLWEWLEKFLDDYCKERSQMAIEVRDFKFRVQRIDGREFLDDEPVFVIRAADKTSLLTLAAYAGFCMAAGSPKDHVDGVWAAYERFEAWQKEHGCKIPD